MSDVGLTREEREQLIRDVFEHARNRITAEEWAKRKEDPLYAALGEAACRVIRDRHLDVVWSEWKAAAATYPDAKLLDLRQDYIEMRDALYLRGWQYARELERAAARGPGPDERERGRDR